MKRRHLKYNKGFTLIEAMITVGVAGIAILGLSQMIVFGMTGTAKTHGAVAFQSLVSEIRVDMFSQTACTASMTLAGAKTPVKLVGAQQPGDAGTSNPKSTIPKIYLPDGVAVLVDSTKNYGSVTNLKFLLYDLGPIDILPANANIHILAINISGVQKAGTAGAPQPISSTVYTHATLTGPGGSIVSCNDGNAFAAYMTVINATGANITGKWMVQRGGDTAGAVIPRPGTLEIAYGTGTMSVPLSSVNSPFGATLPGRGGMFQVSTDTTWTANAYKLW
jgi:prepilin-type N-terminal cleavage/methylation domain-containing protein